MKTRKDYSEEHKCCPKCGSKFIRMTLVGYVWRSYETYKDGNNAKCTNCKWSGIVHDLVKEK